MTKQKILTVALVQQSCTADRARNLAESIKGIHEAAKRGAKLVLLQELHTGLYFCQTEDTRIFDLAEPVPGPSTRELGVVAKELGMVIVASLFEKRAPGIHHNTAAVIEKDGSLAGIYRKMHIPDDPLYYEKFYFTPGDLGFRAQPTSAGSLGTLVCWDQWYPEGARITALKGAQALFFPTAIGWHPSEKQEFGVSQYEAWQTIQRAHAIANGVFVCAVNRVGHEHGEVVHDGARIGGPAESLAGRSAGEGIEFWGGSFIADPLGRILVRAAHEKEEILIADLDLDQIEVARQHWPFLRDRRIDAYAGITSRFLNDASA